MYPNRSEGVPERLIFSLGALLGWVVRDSVFLVVVVVVVLVRPPLGGLFVGLHICDLAKR